MQFKDNFSEILLIAEKPVIFYLDDMYVVQNVELIMNLPTIAQTLTNPNIQMALTIFQMSVNELKKSIKGIEFNSIWELLIQLRELQPGNQFCRAVVYLLKTGFGEQFIGNEKSNSWKINDIEVNEKLFNRIVEIYLISSGLKKYNEQDKFQLDKPQWLIEKEKEIQRIKNQGKNSGGERANFDELTKILIPLNYELGYSFEELFNMNYYHIQFLSRYIPKMIGYDIQKRQILSKKKIKYITEK